MKFIIIRIIRIIGVMRRIILQMNCEYNSKIYLRKLIYNYINYIIIQFLLRWKKVQFIVEIMFGLEWKML